MFSSRHSVAFKHLRQLLAENFHIEIWARLLGIQLIVSIDLLERNMVQSHEDHRQNERALKLIGSELPPANDAYSKRVAVVAFDMGADLFALEDTVAVVLPAAFNRTRAPHDPVITDI